jgi:hypothetical protein
MKTTSKVKTVHEVIKNCVIGDIVTDGKRQWKVTETYKEGGDCVIAQPHNWHKKNGASFEIWDDAQARISIIPGLMVKKFVAE